MYPVFRSLALVLLLCFSPLTLAGPQVLTSIKPLQLIAAAVQDGVAEPDVLLPVGASPHHYALRPSDMRRLQQAQLFYWIGPQLEGFLAKPLSSRTQPSLALQDLPGLQLRYFAEAQDEHGEEEHDHDHQPGALDVICGCRQAMRRLSLSVWPMIWPPLTRQTQRAIRAT